ncbi:MAG: hypothetical protein Q8765_02590, partial [Sweet potato little leaf phytoplasma]|nr:hypothetical protein [Sweet potato little leaf phytoplasma]
KISKLPQVKKHQPAKQFNPMTRRHTAGSIISTSKTKTCGSLQAPKLTCESTVLLKTLKKKLSPNLMETRCW